MWNMIMTLYKEYIGTGMIAGLFLVAVIFLLVSEKNKITRIVFLYMPVLVLALYFFPPFASIVYVFAGEEIYYRLLWLVPVTPVLAYAAVKILGNCKGVKRWMVGIALGGMVILSVSLVYRSPFFYKAENPYHVPRTVVDICEAIEVDGREVVAAFPMELVQYVRQYSPYVCMPYGREMLIVRWNFQDELYTLLNAEEMDAALIVESARKRNCHYVIFREGKTVIGSFEDCGYELFDVVDGYVIYTDPTIYKGL